MEVHRQTCQLCGSRLLKNHLVREPGHQDKVIVQCGGCGSFVARYVINPGGYYHHEKGFESYLRGLSRAGDAISGRQTQDEYEAIHQQSEDLFTKTTAFLKEQGKD
ncbi:MAG: hypothetical protein KJ950_13230 [Proteobacteria bacterium]|nr:hypothetical protein [Pseudomonadota bacterium]MBU1686163.1 hypothetical protein [Pseudomonadota bacterium]